jgi:hypothetical protein
MPETPTFSDDELFRVLGEELSANEMGAAMPPYEVLVQKGRDWMASNKQKLCDSICHSPKLRTFIVGDNFGEEALLVISDIVMHEIIGVPPVAVSMLFVRLGYHKLCHSYLQIGR